MKRRLDNTPLGRLLDLLMDAAILAELLGLAWVIWRGLPLP